jgi:hypothetical protein
MGERERGESSLVFRLEELRKLEASRLAEEREAKARAAREEEAARRLAEERRREEAAALARAREDEAARGRLVEALTEARIEAAKQGELEARRMATEVALRSEAEERRRAHERELLRLELEARAKSRTRRLLGGSLGALCVVALGLCVWLAWVQPKQQATAAIAAARAQLDADDPVTLAAAQGELDLATMRDPGNPALPALRAQLAQKRAAIEAQQTAARAKIETEAAASKRRVDELSAELAARPRAGATTSTRTPTAPSAATSAPRGATTTTPSGGWGVRCPPGVVGVPGCG